jgi:hypothetical protein
MFSGVSLEIKVNQLDLSVVSVTAPNTVYSFSKITLENIVAWLHAESKPTF